MTEFRGVVINGREQNGRTYQREDGTFESLDLKDVQAGETVTIVTGSGAHDLVKGDTKEHASALDGWTLGSAAVRLSLYESDGGAQFRHHGIVLKERLGVYVSYPDSERPNVVYELGSIAGILSRKMAGETQDVSEAQALIDN